MIESLVEHSTALEEPRSRHTEAVRYDVSCRCDGPDRNGPHFVPSGCSKPLPALAHPANPRLPRP